MGIFGKLFGKKQGMSRTTGRNIFSMIMCPKCKKEGIDEYDFSNEVKCRICGEITSQTELHNFITYIPLFGHS